MAKKKKNEIRPEMYCRRDYRRLVHSRLNADRVVVQESDITIYSEASLADEARESLIRHRGYLENYIRSSPGFADALSPLPDNPLAPAVVRDMLLASRSAGVGPMAAVAGAIAQRVGNDLLRHTPRIIVENGGDIFTVAQGPLKIGVFAGPSPLSLKIGIQLETKGRPLSICTSSATVGHSRSMGKADAACVIGESCALADALATAVGNRVGRARDIQPAIDWARQIQGVQGILVILDENIGAWGGLAVVPL